MALLRKCLNELRTRRLSPEHFACAIAAEPDTVLPPVGEEEIARLLARRVPPERSRRLLPAGAPLPLNA